MVPRGRGKGGGVRAGSRTVARLSDELNVRIMRAMIGGFEALTVDREEPSTDVIASMKAPETEHEADPDPGQRYMVTPAGEAGLQVASALEYWLLKAPGGAIAYKDKRAEQAIEALAASWGGMLLHALAPGPRSSEELARELGLSRRRLGGLVKPALKAGLIEAVTGAGDDGGDVAYAPTEWARHGLAPLILGARAERANPEPADRPIDALDLEAALQLIVPLASVPGELSGSCRLVVSLGQAVEPRQAGVTVTIEKGRVVECVPGIELEADATAIGGVRHWFRALIDNRPKRLTYEGDRRLARKLVKDLGEVLFGGG